MLISTHPWMIVGFFEDEHLIGIEEDLSMALIEMIVIILFFFFFA